MTPNKRFAILQDDNSKKIFIYEDEIGWIEQPKESYNLWALQHDIVRKYPNTFIQMMGLG